MKTKNFLLLIAFLISNAIMAQVPPTVSKVDRLMITKNTFDGTKNDTVLVQSSNGMVKGIPRSTFLSRVTTPTPDLDAVLTEGSVSALGMQVDNVGIKSEGFIGSLFSSFLTADRVYQMPNKNGTLATTDDIPTIPDVSATVSGQVNNTPLQELGGVDKLIRGLRIGRGAGTGQLYNLVFGEDSGNAMTNGTRNTLVGWNTGKAITTASDNTVFGASSLVANTTGLNNTAVGSFNQGTATTGNNNTTVGYGVMFSATNTANRNTVIGSGAAISALSGASNVMIGAASGQNSTTANNNVFVGHQAGSNTTTGAGNVIIGSNAGAASLGNSTGNNNTIVGQIITGVTSGSGNTIIGRINGLASTLSNNVVIADGSGGKKIQFDANGQVTLPAQPTTDNTTTTLVGWKGGNLTGVDVSSLVQPPVDLQGAINNSSSLSPVMLPSMLIMGKQFIAGSNTINSSLAIGDDTVGFTSTNTVTFDESSLSVSSQNASLESTNNVRVYGQNELNMIGDNIINLSGDNISFNVGTDSEIKVERISDNYKMTFVKADGNSSIEIDGGTGQASFEDMVDANSFKVTGSGTEGFIYSDGGILAVENAVEGVKIMGNGVRVDVIDMINFIADSPTDVQINNKAIKPYKVYTALLEQDNTGAPVATILENTFDGTPVWTRVSTGIYHLTLTGAFPANKFYNPQPAAGFDAEPDSGSTGSAVYRYYRVSDDVVELSTTTALSPDDSILTNAPFEIKVYY